MNQTSDKERLLQLSAPACAPNNAISEFTRTKHNQASIEQFNNFVQFVLHLNIRQTTTKRSLRGIAVKEFLLHQWFEAGRSVSINQIRRSVPLDAKQIDRLLAYFYRCDTYKLRDRELLPTASYIKKVQRTLVVSGSAFKTTTDDFGLRVTLPIFSVVAKFTRILMPLEEHLSGLYLRAEIILWQSLLQDPRHCLSSQDISERALIPKSTLSTLLESARALDLLVQQSDPNDSRVVRWRLNPQHPTFPLKEQEIIQAFFSASPR